MSYMTPSYILQSSFDSSWTHLAKRYSLWLYRETGWDSEEPNGMPVLFVPGNAGSSRQVRSIASSATRQFYSYPHMKAQEFTGTNHSTLDFFTAEFNEDLSALHGPTLLSQKAYVEASIRYILSRYKHLPNPPTQVMVIGHSMGGVVSASLLPSESISVVITLSSPHSLPPARFDRRIEDLYSDVAHSLYSIPEEIESSGPASMGLTPVLSICGGAPDLMIPGETCHLPPAPKQVSSTGTVPYRRTVFSSGIDVIWTGIGHQEMVWCHQLRWRVARAALEFTSAGSVPSRESILDRWFFSETLPKSNGHSYRFSELNVMPSQVHNPEVGERLILHGTLNSLNGARLYLFRLPDVASQYRTTLLLSRISLIRHSGTSQISKPKVSLFSCSSSSTNPLEWDPESLVCQDLAGSATQIPTVPNSPNSELTGGRECSNSLLPPILHNYSPPSESHFHPLNLPSLPIYLHTHSSGPFIPAPASAASNQKGLNFSIYQSRKCTTESFELKVDWQTTLGRWGVRYYSVPVSWGLGTILLMMFQGWVSWEKGGPFPSPTETYYRFATKTLPYITIAILLLSVVPLPIRWAILGNGGELALAPVSFVCLLLSIGLVGVVWRVLQVLTFSLKVVGRLFKSSGQETPLRSNLVLSSKRGMLSLAVLLALVAFIIPHQVAFVISFCIMTWTCTNPTISQGQTNPIVYEPLSSLSTKVDQLPVADSSSLRRRSPIGTPSRSSSPSAIPPTPEIAFATGNSDDTVSSHHLNLHILLLQTFLLPLHATVLAVWIRTLATAGYTTPFDGDHNIFMVGFWLLVVDAASVRGWERCRWKWR
ncbi:GPI inositol deacylase [Tulasnella sp. 418]|nr:GPI inositol deacylase [Tulasnella sp. 418]